MKSHHQDTLILPFEYNQHRYEALVTRRTNDDNKEYRIVIMNGELEKILFGHHILFEQNGRFQSDHTIKDKSIQELQQAVMQALTDQLKKENALGVLV